MSSAAIRIPEAFFKQAKARGKAEQRSTAAQVAYWALLGKIAEDNPDLPFPFIKDILIGMQEMKAGDVSSYEFENEKGT